MTLDEEPRVVAEEEDEADGEERELWGDGDKETVNSRSELSYPFARGSHRNVFKAKPSKQLTPSSD